MSGGRYWNESSVRTSGREAQFFQPTFPDPASGIVWMHSPGDVYEITGTLVNGRRFDPIRLTDPGQIKHYNIYRGTVWVRPAATGKRKKLWDIYN